MYRCIYVDRIVTGRMCNGTATDNAHKSFEQPTTLMRDALEY